MLNENILVMVDFSYFCYVVAYNAMSHFETNYRDEFNAMIKPPEETDQSNLPNPLTNSNFKKELARSFQTKLEGIDWILREHFQQDIDLASRIDYVLAIDDNLLNSFRKQIFPEYKSQRKLIKKSYSFGSVRDYLLNILLPELNRSLSDKYITIKVEGAEGDDIIAAISKNINNYRLKVVIGSDKDLLQIDGIHLIDIFGNEKTREAWKDGPTMTPKQFLITKIIKGDTSDNISNIKKGIGDKKAYKFASDLDALKAFLKENHDSAEQFLMNRKLMSFDMIPKELEDKIIAEANSKLLLRENQEKQIKESFSGSLTNLDDL